MLVTDTDGQPAPKIVDFGIAKATTSQHLTEMTMLSGHRLMVGTPDYMSPEQADPAEIDIDTTTDIYSLGVMLYELLAGARPFEADAIQRAVATSASLLPDRDRAAAAERPARQCLVRLERYASRNPVHGSVRRKPYAAGGDATNSTRTAAARLVALYEAWNKPARAAAFRSAAQPKS